MSEKAKQKAPWKKDAPKSSGSTKLTAAQKKKAKSRAARAGREYPNLVDSMWATKQ